MLMSFEYKIIFLEPKTNSKIDVDYNGICFDVYSMYATQVVPEMSIFLTNQSLG